MKHKILKINPLLIKSNRSWIIPPYECLDFDKLFTNVQSIIYDLENLNKEEDDVSFQLISSKKIPSKTNRISKTALMFLEWINSGTRYKRETETIILIFWTKKEILLNNIELFKKLEQVLKDKTKDWINYENLKSFFPGRTNTDSKQNFISLFSFLEKSYGKIFNNEIFKIEKNEEYIGQIMCNNYLFEGSEGAFKFDDSFEIKNTRYLSNIVKNNLVAHSSPYFNDVFLKREEIPKVSNKVIIGVLDSSCPPNKNIITKHYANKDEDNYFHGENVSSIAMFGDKLNNFDDGCGVFQILHCRVYSPGMFEYELINNVRKAISENPFIRIWNFSLGADNEINPYNEISFIGQELDKISEEYNVIIVIAGGNDKESSRSKYLTPPSDSLRSIVVNSTNKQNKSSSYSRRGASFLNYTKPDCSIFGGDIDDNIYFLNNGIKINNVGGTSFAAPFVARIIASIIEKLPKLNNLEVLALFYSSLKETGNKEFLGNGIVPNNINKIIESDKNEIIISFSGEFSDKEVLNNKFPIPLNEGLFDYEISITTLCNGRIDHQFGVESIRTSITSIFAEKTEEQSTSQSHKTKWSEIETINEKNLISLQKKWSINNKKTFDFKKPIKFPGQEFCDWIIKLTKENRGSTDYSELADTSIKYAIIIKMKNKKNIDNYQKLFNRLKILNFNPVILAETQIFLDEEINLKK